MKHVIQNRNGLNIVVRVQENPADKGLLFLEHGLTGAKDQPLIKAAEKTFYDFGYTTVNFDVTCSIGESDGEVDDVTFTSHYSDLKDVIEWAKKQDWYKEPFVVSGHSLGGMATTLYAQENPEKMDFIVPLSPATSGKDLEEAKRAVSEESFQDWKEKGYFDKVSKFNGKQVKVPFALQKDLYNYDVLKNIDKLKCPTYIITGDEDTATPLSYVKRFFDALVCEKKELKVLEGCPHSPYDEKDIENFEKTLKEILENK